MSTLAKQQLIDPSLTDALQQWAAFSAENRQNAQILMNAITPVKDRVEVAEELLEAMRQTDWLQASSKLADPGVLARSYGELVDIQIAAMGRLQDAGNALLQTTLSFGEQLTRIPQGADNAQALLATYLLTSLNFAKQYQADATSEASSLSAIEAAYGDWFQKSLQGLNA